MRQDPAGKQRQSLPGIEDEGNLRGGEFAHVRAHAFPAVGCDDAERDVGDIADAVAVRFVHRAGMKRSDLVVVEIGDDESLRRVRAGNDAHAVRSHVLCRQPLQVAAPVVSHGGHHHGLAAEALEVVRDVPRAATPFAPHLADLKRDREHVRLAGQDVPGEAVGKHHDGVERERPADKRARGGPDEIRHRSRGRSRGR